MRIILSRTVLKEIPSLPSYIQDKLHDWIDSVETRGLAETRKVPGWHDEPLKGKRSGQRSVRLNKSYRAIYEETSAIVLTIEEVNKHKY